MRDDHHAPKCINLWAGPGTGKSRTAAGVFTAMKSMGLRVELVTEKAKFYTYEGNVRRLKDQFLLMCQQEYCQRIVRDQVDWIVTDSPPGMGIAYARRLDRKVLHSMQEHFRNRYANFDILLLRDDTRPYQTYGRFQTEAEARDLDINIAGIWAECTVHMSCHDYHRLVADDLVIDTIIEKVVEPHVRP